MTSRENDLLFINCVTQRTGSRTAYHHTIYPGNVLHKGKIQYICYDLGEFVILMQFSRYEID